MALWSGSVVVLTILFALVSSRQPHVIFNPSSPLDGSASETASKAKVDAEPSSAMDDDVSVAPGYGLNGGQGDLSPWLPSSPTWAQQPDKHLRVISRPSSYIVNRPSPAGDRIDTVNNGPPAPPGQAIKPGKPGRPESVSETDMYLLGAIEKLVYRVDFLEKRLRRTEELVYYLMEGSANNKDAAEPCPKDFTRAGRHCYHFAGKDLNWKSSSSACKAMDSILLEVSSLEDKVDLINWINAHQEFRGRDFWTGGLNPGLLWIWANSAKPVIASSDTNNSANAINNQGNNDITGNGRCLKLAFNPATRQYNYQGGDCSSRYRFICILEEPSSSRALSRIHKSLNISLDREDPGPPAGVGTDPKIRDAKS